MTDIAFSKIQSAQPSSARRRFLKSCVGVAATLSVSPVLAKLQSPVRTLDFKNLHTGEALSATYWAEGEYLKEEMKLVNRVLRDHRTGDVCDMDAQLMDTLHVLQQLVGVSGQYHVISGYRSPATNAKLHAARKGVAKKSFHMQGKAIDVYLPGCELNALRNAAISLQAGGVGYYARSNFIHLDTGKVRSW